MPDLLLGKQLHDAMVTLILGHAKDTRSVARKATP